MANNEHAKHASRDNSNKVDLTVLPSVALYEEAKVWMHGEKKYGRDNWKKLWGERTLDVANASLLRHAFKLAEGEVFDSESGLPHAAHIRCNAAMILQYMADIGLIYPEQLKTEGEFNTGSYFEPSKL